MSAERNHKDTSFAGFLNEYSRGNVAASTQLNAIVSAEISKIIDTIDEIVNIIDTDKGSQISEQLKLAKNILLPTDEHNIDKLISFSRILELLVILYPAVYKFIDDDKKHKFSDLFNKLIVEFITIVKKIGNSALLETAIRLIQRIDH